GWTALLPGFIVGGIGIGLTNPALAATALSTVPREQAGVGSGVNATFRQIGIATGIAALGAIFQHQLSSHAGGHGAPPKSGGVGSIPPAPHPPFLAPPPHPLRGGAPTAR